MCFIHVLKKNIISISKFTSRGGCVNIYERFITMKRGEFKITGFIRNDLFVVDMQIQIPQVHLNTSDSILLHRRLGHANHQAIQKIDNSISKIPFCEVCATSNNPRKPYSIRKNIASEVLQRIHSDVFGPVTTSIGGSKYYISFTDEYTRYSTIYFMEKKSQSFGFRV